MTKLKKILVVDDDHIVRFLAREIIEVTGLAKEVDEATNGAEAIEYLLKSCIKKNDCPDLILLDVKMPVIDGLEFLDLKQNLPTTAHIPAKIVMVSSSARIPDLEREKELGAVDYIVMPLTAEKIIAVIDKIK